MPGPLARPRAPQPTRHRSVGSGGSDLHVLEGLIFLLSLAIVWLGLYLANGYS
jgi:hypothetical protein